MVLVQQPSCLPLPPHLQLNCLRSRLHSRLRGAVQLYLERGCDVGEHDHAHMQAIWHSRHNNAACAVWHRYCCTCAAYVVVAGHPPHALVCAQATLPMYTRDPLDRTPTDTLQHHQALHMTTCTLLTTHNASACRQLLMSCCQPQ